MTHNMVNEMNGRIEGLIKDVNKYNESTFLLNILQDDIDTISDRLRDCVDMFDMVENVHRLHELHAGLLEALNGYMDSIKKLIAGVAKVDRTDHVAIAALSEEGHRLMLDVFLFNGSLIEEIEQLNK